MCVIKIKLLTPFLTLNFRFRSLITYFVCCHFFFFFFFLCGMVDLEPARSKLALDSSKSTFLCLQFLRVQRQKICCHFNVSSFFDYFFFRRMPFLQREINEQIREMNIFVYLLDLSYFKTLGNHSSPPRN